MSEIQQIKCFWCSIPTLIDSFLIIYHHVVLIQLQLLAILILVDNLTFLDSTNTRKFRLQMDEKKSTNQNPRN